MFLDLIASFGPQGFHQGGKVVAAEIFGFIARATDQQVLVPDAGSDIRMAAILLVDALDEPQLLQFFQGAVDSHQSQAAARVA